MSRVSGFPPVVKQGARILILGSMPGRASLDKKQYYALPQNAFWRIMGDFFDAGLNSPYTVRLERINENHIGLWDVLENCHRQGSLDSAIEMASARANDFERFFRRHSGIEHVFFNGKKAAEIYRRLVLTSIGDTCPGINYRTLPSTSPAHAAMSYAEKLKQWSAIVSILQEST
jgi:hypoxanthine-DNA glycosylase